MQGALSRDALGNLSFLLCFSLLCVFFRLIMIVLVCMSLGPGSEYAGGALKGHLGQFVFSFVFFITLCLFLFVFVSSSGYDCVCLRPTGARQ